MTGLLKKLPAWGLLKLPLAAAILFFFISSMHAGAQTKITSALIKPDTAGAQVLPNDSLVIRGGSIKLTSELQAKSGSLAMLFSAILPGAGQVYAHRYYTIPFIYGFGIYFSSVAVKANNQYEDYRGKFSRSVSAATPSGDPNLLNARDFYRDQRDEFILYLGLTYFLNIIDAYVGATLYDFDVSDELGGSSKIQFRMRLP